MVYQLDSFSLLSVSPQPLQLIHQRRRKRGYQQARLKRNLIDQRRFRILIPLLLILPFINFIRNRDISSTLDRNPGPFQPLAHLVLNFDHLCMRWEIYSWIDNSAISIHHWFLTYQTKQTHLDIDSLTEWHLRISLYVLDRHVDSFDCNPIRAMVQLDYLSTTAEDFGTARDNLDLIANVDLPFLGLDVRRTVWQLTGIMSLGLRGASFRLRMFPNSLLCKCDID